MSTELPRTESPAIIAPELWLDDLRAAAQARQTWIWQGYLAPGAITLLTSQWKSGKTTLVAALLARLKAGGAFAGLPVAPTRAVVVSEEDPAHWVRRSQQLDFADSVCWLCRPFRGKPRPEHWQALIDRLADLHAHRSVGLAVIDPLAAFFPGRDESNAGLMLETLSTLQTLTAAGMAILLLHHPRRRASPPGQAARGSGALPGHADILIEMAWYQAPSETNRRRRLRAFSRFPETPPDLVLELNAAGTDYTVVDTTGESDFTKLWEPLHAILIEAERKLTRREIRNRWTQQPVPDGSTIFRLLDRAFSKGLIYREGRGRRGDPHRYWLIDQESRWAQDPRFIFRQITGQSLPGSPF